MKKIGITLLALLAFGLVLTGCKASGEIGDTSSSIVSPR
jgi:hypothetical protein